MTGSGVLKKNLLSLQNLIFEIDPVDSSCSQKLQYPERTILFQNSPFKVEMSTTALLKHLLYLMNIFNRSCETVKLTHSP